MKKLLMKDIGITVWVAGYIMMFTNLAEKNLQTHVCFLKKTEYNIIIYIVHVIEKYYSNSRFETFSTWNINLVSINHWCTVQMNEI